MYLLYRNPPPGIPSRQNIVDILLAVMVHDKENAFSVSYGVSYLVHSILSLCMWLFISSHVDESEVTVHASL